MAELSFLEVLDAFLAEIDERLPGYFDRQPLRYVAKGRDAETYRAIARAWEIGLLPVDEELELNAVDRYLAERLAAVGATVGDVTGQRAQGLTAFRGERAEARAKARARIDRFRRQLEPPDSSEAALLHHVSFGEGDPPIVVINALGQTFEAWLPLIERLSRRRRLVLWHLRETDDIGRPVSFSEHCDDLRTVIEQTNAKPCHLLAWCTGAKLALYYCRRHPDEVRSMVFFAGSFKHPGRSLELDTEYERNLESMLQVVVEQPMLADRLLTLLTGGASDDAGFERLNDQELADRALTGVPAALHRDVRHPFRDVASFRIYARQHVEHWNHDVVGTELDVPILGLIGEHDSIVSEEGLREALAQFRAARLEVVVGTTHYCFYERSDAVAALIQEWVASAQ